MSPVQGHIVTVQPRIFIARARSDLAEIEALRVELVRMKANWTVLPDVESGPNWWDVARASIDACSLFAFCGSPSFVASMSCLQELDYARRANRPTVHVRLTPELPSWFTEMVREIPTIDFAEAGLHESATRLDALLRAETKP